MADTFLEAVLCTYGKPCKVRIDGGFEFMGAFASLMATLGVEVAKTCPVSPWTNGIAERMVGFTKKLIRKVLVGMPKEDWSATIPWVQHAINSTVSRATGFSPHEVFFGEAPSPLISSMHSPPVDAQVGVTDNAA